MITAISILKKMAPKPATMPTMRARHVRTARETSRSAGSAATLSAAFSDAVGSAAAFVDMNCDFLLVLWVAGGAPPRGNLAVYCIFRLQIKRRRETSGTDFANLSHESMENLPSGPIRNCPSAAAVPIGDRCDGANRRGLIRQARPWRCRSRRRRPSSRFAGGPPRLTSAWRSRPAGDRRPASGKASTPLRGRARRR